MSDVELLPVVRLVIGAGLPLALGISMFFTDRAEKARVEKENAKRRETGGVTPPEERRAGTVRIRVHVVGEGSVNLGSSTESADSVSGAPTLESTAFVVEDDQGQRFSIAEKTELRVRTLAGARRNLLESVTKEGGGIAQRFSFEVDPSATFVLQAKFPETKDSQGAFREGPVAIEGPLVINPNTDVDTTGFGCIVYPALAIGAACALYPTELVWEVLGWIVWGLAMIVGAGGRAITNDNAR